MKQSARRGEILGYIYPLPEVQSRLLGRFTDAYFCLGIDLHEVRLEDHFC